MTLKAAGGTALVGSPPGEGLIGMSPLLAAAACGQHDILRFLLECVDPSERHEAVNQTIGSGAGTTALMFAAAGGFYEVCALLIANGAATMTLDNQQPVAVDALQRAVAGGYTSCVRLLLDNGGHADHRNARGQTYLLYALLFGHMETASLLVEMGCDLNAQFTAMSQPGVTVLMVAAVRGIEDAVEFCLARLSPQEVRRRDHNGANAADWAGRGRRTELRRRIERATASSVDPPY